MHARFVQENARAIYFQPNRGRHRTSPSSRPVQFVTWRIFTTLLSRFVERISTMKSPLLAARRRVLTSAFRVTCILVLFTYFFWYFSFSSVRRTAFQLAIFPSALSVCRLIVGRFAIATTQPPTSAEDRRLQLVPFAEATYYFVTLAS